MLLLLRTKSKNLPSLLCSSQYLSMVLVNSLSACTMKCPVLQGHVSPQAAFWHQNVSNIYSLVSDFTTISTETLTAKRTCDLWAECYSTVGIYSCGRNQYSCVRNLSIGQNLYLIVGTFSVYQKYFSCIINWFLRHKFCSWIIHFFPWTEMIFWHKFSSCNMNFSTLTGIIFLWYEFCPCRMKFFASVAFISIVQQEFSQILLM